MTTHPWLWSGWKLVPRSTDHTPSCKVSCQVGVKIDFYFYAGGHTHASHHCTHCMTRG